ncbi:uncharacterized protein EV422DRAFT_531858 [Fimicolochytrium jonesii]|uniref:uncharacterized protein n=1 Tax=Fimicolochytrium jonesii TaxID=1396493 RepID=UPI0022FEF114|nr:uncharacterized protein EV422DRAFT_531858 [Fimicolochytrium jonesii]KAI8820154.1 hypothetical protein EV422DRAFT_531858 [Fimicolochytrium jonesii]
MNLPMDDGKKLRAAANVGRLIAKPAGTAAAVGAAKPAAPESAKDKTANANANGNAQNAAPTAAGQRNTGLTSQSDQSDASSFSATPSPPFNDFGVPRHYNGPSAVTHNPYHPSPLQVQHPIQGSDTGIAYNATGLFIPHLANSPHQQHQRPQQHQQQQEQQQFRLQDDGNQQAHPSPLMPTHPMLYAPQPRHAAFSDIQRSNTPPVFPAQHHFQIEAPVRPTSTPVDGSFQQQQQQQQQQQMYAQQQWGYEQQQQQGQGQGGDEGYAQGAATPGKKYKCPKPFCSKVYKNSNGLKYHLEHGNCELDYEHHAAASSAMSSQGSPLLSAATPAPHPNHPRTSSPSPSDYMHPSPAMPHANMGAAAAAAAAHPEFATPYYLPPNSPHTSTLYTHQLDPHNHNHPYNTHPQQHPNYPYAALQGQQQFTPAPYLPFTSNLPLFSPLGLSQLSPGLAAAHAQDIKIALRPYWCRVQGCGKKYKNLNGLKYHAKVCHKDMDFKTEVKGHTSMNL